jgi:phosphatidylserine/phosphatidylglycerophosphate/cardiolipin synthase-like enzyme
LRGNAVTIGDDLRSAIQRAVVELPTNQLHKLAAACQPFETPDAIARHLALNAVPTAVFRHHVAAICAAWVAAPSVPGAALALALRAAADAAAEVRDTQRVEVVWTGPSSPEVPVRATSAVLADLIDEAATELILVSFAAYKVPAILDRLAAATTRGVVIHLILESTEESRGRLSYDARLAFDTLGASVAFYVWPAHLRTSTRGGHAAMHAKCAVVDQRIAFVTSANLTASGITDNMELGLLVESGPVPHRIASHFRALIAATTLRRVA